MNAAPFNPECLTFRCKRRGGKQVQNKGTHLNRFFVCQRRRNGLALRRYFEALEICNEKFKLQASRMARVLGGGGGGGWGGGGGGIHLTLHIYISNSKVVVCVFFVISCFNKYIFFDILIVLCQGPHDGRRKGKRE